jgi:hypothetical protein
VKLTRRSFLTWTFGALALALTLTLSLACSSTPKTSAVGDSSGSTRTCTDIITETSTAPDGTVTGVETCESRLSLRR